ncbi:MAG: LCP family protein [Actinomycetota bacterium]|nr:LCP family protein [Actinomycetota bacterium]
MTKSGRVPAHRRSRRRHIPIRRWPRRLLVTINVVTALSLLSAGTVYGYVRYRVSQLKTQAAPHIVATAPLAAQKGSDGLEAMNILLIGNNTRTGLSPAEAAQFGSSSDVGGARSDVTMVLHLDPKANTASLLSIPRDFFVSLPPHSIAGGYGKIDAALNGINGDPKTGPDNLIQAVEDDLGIPINHYISINFDGFQQTINAIGGIKMNFPVPLRDQPAALNVTAGCQTLNGHDALAVVRARHLQYYQGGRWQNDPESDLSRIVRDHIFLKIFANTAKAQLTDVFKANALIVGLLNQVTVDPGLNGSLLLQIFKHYRHLNVDAVPETTLPITVINNYYYEGGSYGDVDMPVEPLDHQVIDTWAGIPLAASSPASISVSVVNISGIYHKANQIADGLTAIGFHVTGTSTAPVPASITETVIRYHPYSVADAIGVLRSLSGSVRIQADPTVPAGQVVVDSGSVVAVIPPPPPTVPSTTAVVGSPTTTARTGSTSTSTPTTLPTAGNQPPSPSGDQISSWDPTPC